jgi:hypothetical protein
LGPARLTKLGERRARSTPCSPSDHSGLVTGRCHSDRRRTGSLALSSRRISRSWCCGSVACRGVRGSAVLAACRLRAGLREGARVLPAASGGLPRRLLPELAVGDTRRLTASSRPTSRPRAQPPAGGVRGESTSDTCVARPHNPVPQAEETANTLLGVKGSQVQILSSRRHDGRFLATGGAAHQRSYLRKRSAKRSSVASRMISLVARPCRDPYLTGANLEHDVRRGEMGSRSAPGPQRSTRRFGACS